MRSVKKLVIVGLLLATSSGVYPAARRNIDFKKLRGEIRIFEGIVNTSMIQELGNPLAIVDDTRGTYIPGTGVTFTLLISLTRSTMDTPFGRREIESYKGPRDQKIKSLRERLLSLISEYGNTIDQLAPDEFVVVAAHMEDRIVLNPADQNQVVILKVSKKDLTEYQLRKISQQQLRSRIEIIEY